MGQPSSAFLVVAFVLAACRPGYTGANCASVELGTSVAELPVLPASEALSSDYGTVIRGPSIFACCDLCTPVSCTCATEAACALPENRATAIPLGGKYEGEPCSDGIGGVAHCWAWVRDGGVVAVQAFCQN